MIGFRRYSGFFLGLLLSSLLLILGGFFFLKAALPDVEALSSLNDVELAAQTIKIEIYDRFLSIFGTVVATMAAIVTILGIGSYGVLKASLEKRVDSVIRSRLEAEVLHSTLTLFNEVAFTWYHSYEDALQEFLSANRGAEQEKIEEAKRFANAALECTRKALNVFHRLSDNEQREFLSDPRGLGAYCNMLNQSIYAYTASTILSERIPTFSNFEEVCGYADELELKILDRKLLSTRINWYDSFETVGFFRVCVGTILGDELLRARGAANIATVISGRSPKGYLSGAPSEEASRTESEHYGPNRLIRFRLQKT
ncbi:hypothetical protein [Jannaschia helgolandensis]|uniref:hypothetical protein n=1 Tax=Jannaschia helgolandensis TaxID=188906 RepID=UPI0030DBD540